MPTSGIKGDPLHSAIPSPAGSHGLHGHPALVLGLGGAQALAAGHTLLDPLTLEDAARGRGLTHNDLFEALQTLVHAGLVDMRFVKPSLVTLLRLTPAGVRGHLAATRPDLADVRSRVLAALREGAVGWQGGAPVDLAAAVGEQFLVVEVVMEDLRREGRVVFSPAPGRRLRVHRLVP